MIDMHTHTNFSDGDLSPQELVNLAIEKEIEVLSITDHNTIDGIKTIDKNNQAIKDEIQIINGIELSVKRDYGRMHILGYGFDINNEYLNKKLRELKDNSTNLFLSTMEQIKRDYGISFSYNDIKELINKNHNLGRPDLAKLCIKYGYAQTVKEAFDKYLIESYNKIRKYSKGIVYEECLDIISKSEGISILAHPKSLHLEEKEFLILLKDMINCGLKGIEVYHSTHTIEEIRYYEKIAEEYNLLISGGSDYHGKLTKPDIDIGIGKGNLKIKELTLLKELNKTSNKI